MTTRSDYYQWVTRIGKKIVKTGRVAAGNIFTAVFHATSASRYGKGDTFQGRAKKGQKFVVEIECLGPEREIICRGCGELKQERQFSNHDGLCWVCSKRDDDEEI
jgi:hypothetical protein